MSAVETRPSVSAVTVRTKPQLNRVLLFCLIVLFHLLLIWILTLIKFSEVEKNVKMEPMTERIQARPPEPPRAAPAPVSPHASGLVSNPIKTPTLNLTPLQPILTPFPQLVTLPLDRMSAMDGHLAPSDSLEMGGGNQLGKGKGTGTGTGIGGLDGIRREEHLVAVLDTCPGLHEAVWRIQKQLSSDYPYAHVVLSTSSEGEFIETPDHPPGLNGRTVHDLYEGFYLGLKDHPETTSVYLIADFRDHVSAQATQDMIEELRKRGIRLYLCSIELPPYAGLVEYARESGGDFFQMTEDQITSLKRH